MSHKDGVVCARSRAFLPVRLLAPVLMLALSGSAWSQSPGVLFVGEVNANDVYLRSGDSLNHYTIAKVSAGDRLSIVSERGDWYEVLPPEGVFSLISGDYVDQSENGRGIVNGDNVRVRAGSSLNSSKYTVQTLLSKGDAVTVLGKNADGFLRIAPPAGATVWIAKEFIAHGTGAALPSASQPAGSSTNRNPSPATSRGSATPTPSPAEATDSGVGNDAVDESPSVGGTSELTPQPAERNVQSASTKREVPPGFENLPVTATRRALVKLDERTRAELAKPMEQREFDEILSEYETIANQTEDELASAYARARFEQVSDMNGLVATVQRLRSLDAKAGEERRSYMEQRASIPAATPPVAGGLDARGLLKTSALYPKGSVPRRFRLIDTESAAGGTIAYVEVPAEMEAVAESLVGKVVGVRASASQLLRGGVNPVPVYTAAELVEVTLDGKPVSAETEAAGTN